MDKQAEARVHRIGQTKEVLILRLVTITEMEERVMTVAFDKLETEAKVIKLGGFDRMDAGVGDQTDEELRKQMVWFHFHALVCVGGGSTGGRTMHPECS